jgi:hypothetical protein
MGKTNNPTGIGGFKPGQSGNPSGVSKNGLGNRPYRAALRIEAAIHENGGRLPKVRKGSLRYLARQALMRAGNNTAALEHVANRLDGPIIPAPDDPPSQQIVEIRIVMVEADPHLINHTPQEEIESAEFANRAIGSESKLLTVEKPNQDAEISQSSTCPEDAFEGKDVGTD